MGRRTRFLDIVPGWLIIWAIIAVVTLAIMVVESRISTASERDAYEGSIKAQYITIYMRNPKNPNGEWLVFNNITKLHAGRKIMFVSNGVEYISGPENIIIENRKVE